MDEVPPKQEGKTPAPESETLIPGVKHVLAISSGKGGVGKSTVSVNVAVALQATGKKVGLLDADIYGPNIPMMMGVKKPPTQQDGKIAPAENFGIKVISMGFFVPEETAVVWRGPMVHTAIQQFFRDVVWGDLDYLLIDLPPGTGDAQLSLTQIVPLWGAITVTTPQEVALHDVKKGIMMFQKVNVPIVGIIENMSYFVCGHCGERTDIFDYGGGERAAEKLGIPFLGRIPIDPAIRSGGDVGTPIVTADPSSPQSLAFKEIAVKIIHQTDEATTATEGQHMSRAPLRSLINKIKNSTGDPSQS